MDYSDDNCLYEFTPAQVTRMFAQYTLYRIGRQDITLQDSVTSGPTDMLQHELQTYVLQVPSGSNVECTSEASDTFGDVDIYMRDGATPDISTNNFGCTSQSVGSSEACSMLSQTGRVYVSAYAYRGTGGVAMTCSGTGIVDTVLELSSGVSSPPFDLVANGEKVLTLQIGDPDTQVVCLLEPSTDSATIFVRFDQPPDPNTNDYECTTSGLSSCTVVNPTDAQTLWVLVTSSVAVSGLSVICSIGSAPIPLENGVSSEPISLSTGMVQSYIYDVTPGSTVSCQIEPIDPLSLGDADLFLQYDAEADIVNLAYACASLGETSVEGCVLDVPEGVSTIWATVEAWEAFQDVFITCTSEFSLSAITLIDGQPSDPLSLPALETQTYRLVVTQGPNVICATDHLVEDYNYYYYSSADADLYVSG